MKVQQSLPNLRVFVGFGPVYCLCIQCFHAICLSVCCHIYCENLALQNAYFFYQFLCIWWVRLLLWMLAEFAVAKSTKMKPYLF